VSTRVYHFGLGYRVKGINVVAGSAAEAMTKAAAVTGRPDLLTKSPKWSREFDPVRDLGTAVADPYLETMLSADSLPLLRTVGKIRPEWTLDRRTGKVRVSGEFEGFPEWLLDLSGKPTAAEVRTAGGIFNPGGGLDCLLRDLADGVGRFLGSFEDGDGLRSAILDEVDRLERYLAGDFGNPPDSEETVPF
jgi:hypothetical protein